MVLRHTFAILLLSMALPVASFARFDNVSARFALSQSGGGLGGKIEQSVTFHQDHAGNWFVSRTGSETNWCGSHDKKGCIQTNKTIYGYIDGRTCPALRRVMQQLLTAQSKERGSAHPHVSDTPLLSVITFDRGLEKTERLAEYQGPLVDWWTSAQKQLKLCWSKIEPHF